ncbi:MAG: hypothetical protein FJ261_10845 [Planctomycetes bacterium]|nr:hypothetical protein [Planctomycetota bacterium]
MSHGGGGGEVVEPNLTPLLDLVMQLLMFFIICVRFVTDQVKAEIQVPDNQEARRPAKGVDTPIILNMIAWDPTVLRFIGPEKVGLKAQLGDARYLEVERLFNLFKGSAQEIAMANESFKPGEAMVVTQGRADPLYLRKGGRRRNADRISDVSGWLRDAYQELPKDAEGNKVLKKVRIRADRNVEYQDVHALAEVCRNNQFKDLTYGVMIPTPGAK